jgi:hypothetical protein
MKTSFTPGPWRHRRRGGAEYTTIEDAKGRGIASTYGGDQEANAALIASAPELLAACRRLFALAVAPDNYLEEERQALLSAARAAVAAAEGE